MARAIRGHLLGAFLLLGMLGIWARYHSVVPAGSVEESLQRDLEGLASDSVVPDEVPALAQWVFRDSKQPKALRMKVLSAAIDAKLRHRIRLPARAEEDPFVLLSLVLEPGLKEQLYADCPDVPPELSVICDAEEWRLFEQSVGRALLDLMDAPQEFAAASRVGGNDLSLQAADALCSMGHQGVILAEQQLREARTTRGAVLGIMALGCAGERDLDDSVLQEWMRHPSSPGIRLAARLECASRPGCQLADVTGTPTSAMEALSAFSSQIQRGSQ